MRLERGFPWPDAIGDAAGLGMLTGAVVAGAVGWPAYWTAGIGAMAGLALGFGLEAWQNIPR